MNYNKAHDHSLTHITLVTKYFTNAIFHQSGKIQQKVSAKMDQFYSSDQVYMNQSTSMQSSACSISMQNTTNDIHIKQEEALFHKILKMNRINE